jgi:hypothetical protein
MDFHKLNRKELAEFAAKVAQQMSKGKVKVFGAEQDPVKAKELLDGSSRLAFAEQKREEAAALAREATVEAKQIITRLQCIVYGLKGSPATADDFIYLGFDPPAVVLKRERR